MNLVKVTNLCFVEILKQYSKIYKEVAEESKPVLQT